MRITRCNCRLLHVPTDPPRAAPAEVAAGRLAHIIVLFVQLDTDAGLTGLGMAYALQGTGRGLDAVAVNDVAPLLVGENPLDHERLAAKFYWRLQSVGRRGLVAQAYSAFDLALWDLKGKAAGLPLYRLLGGARESTPAYGSDTAWLWMSPEEVLDASRPYLDQGLMGIKVKVGQNPQQDADKLTRLREWLGDEVWLAVDANQRYDYGTALAMGHFFEEEIGCDWFEEPLLCEDVAGHARLAAKLEIPLAGGETLFGREEFRAYLEQDTLAVLQPDVTRLGGLTAWLKVAALHRFLHFVVLFVLSDFGFVSDFAVRICFGFRSSDFGFQETRHARRKTGRGGGGRPPGRPGDPLRRHAGEARQAGLPGRPYRPDHRRADAARLGGGPGP